MIHFLRQTRILLLFSVLPLVVKSEISEECAAQSDVLQATPAIREELGRLTSFIESDPLDNFCKELELDEEEKAENPRLIKFVCVIDYSDFTHEMEALCNESNGQYFESEFFVTCRDEQVEFTLGSQNIPACVAKICDQANIEKEFDSLFGKAEEQLQQDGLECEVRYDGEGQEPSVTGLSTSSSPQTAGTSSFTAIFLGAASSIVALAWLL